jgi:LPS-assembly protein
MRRMLLFITTILAPLGHQHLEAQEVANKEPLTAASQTALPEEPVPQQNAPGGTPLDLTQIPRATPFSPGKAPDRVTLDSDNPQTRNGDLYAASGNVVITFRDHTLYADSVTYDASTGEVNATGHMKLIGGANNEHIEASHGTYNLQTGTGRFYDVTGSVEAQREYAPVSSKPPSSGSAFGSSSPSRALGYQNSNPFLFGGRIVAETEPQEYEIYDGWMTSCLLPSPDWLLSARKLKVSGGKAHASRSTFKLLGIPLLIMPYVTHPTDENDRQSGLLIPTIGYSSASKDTGSKGLTIGEQAYLTLGRSRDLTVGTIYYSLRGFSENGTFRYRGPGDDFLTAHFSALQDRGFVDSNGIYNNQGGEDFTVAYRRQLSPNVRVIVDSEYLSSYIYREVFTPNFNEAVSTDITSTVYVTDQHNGFSLDGRFDRYEGLKVVPTSTEPGEEVKIFHSPSIDFDGLDRPIPGTPFLWNITSSFAALKRVEPDFATAGLTERFDLRPELALPLAFNGWHVLSSAAVEETAYTRSRLAPYSAIATPIELNDPLNRADVDFKVDVRPPAIERTFEVPEKWQWLLGKEVRHTIEPNITYRDVRGINNFLGVLRFDDRDLMSNTNEIEYGATQHLYFRARPKAVSTKPGCPAKPVTVDKTPDTATTPDTETDDLGFDQRPTLDANGIPNASASAPDQPIRTHARHPDPCAPTVTTPPQQEWFSWKLAQKRFFDSNFGGAIINHRRNIFDTTLDFSGIAFLTEPRSISPLISRMRFRTSSHTDVEWDFDLDTGAKRFTSQNILLDAHEGHFFGGFSYAHLNAPGRTYTEIINPTTNEVTGLTSSAVADFSQMRFLAGYGTPTKPGLTAAAGVGIDLNLDETQYMTLQTSYNWNCCGFAIEYRKYDLGTIRNEGAYTFNFTLANIGGAGNLRRATSLF